MDVQELSAPIDAPELPRWHMGVQELPMLVDVRELPAWVSRN